MSWVKTDKHVYGCIWREHHKDLQVFGSFSNPEPSQLSNQPEMLTEWGFKNAERPLIKIVTKWEHGQRQSTQTDDVYIWRDDEKRDLE